MLHISKRLVLNIFQKLRGIETGQKVVVNSKIIKDKNVFSGDASIFFREKSSHLIVK